LLHHAGTAGSIRIFGAVPVLACSSELPVFAPLELLPAVELLAEPPDAPVEALPLDPAAEPPPARARAKLVVNAKATASVIVVSFI
jgi:hypothetical protein